MSLYITATLASYIGVPSAKRVPTNGRLLTFGRRLSLLEVPKESLGPMVWASRGSNPFGVLVVHQK
jgi:hypothetical protein